MFTLRRTPQLYCVALSDGVYQLYAEDTESAAYAALELAEDRSAELIDVHYLEDWN